MSLPGTLQNFWDDQTSIIAALYELGEISLAQSAQNVFAKSLILTAASFFETEIRDVVIKAIHARSQSDECIVAFCHRKGIERQFHTWFDWKQNNANVFFSMFGDALKKSSADVIRNDEKFALAVKDYMFIGRVRNELVHQNFLTYPFEETAAQTRDRIESATQFLKLVEKMLVPLVDEVTSSERQ